jgi:spore germination cell wall hydrolase CwlJ-like protein
MLKKYIIVLIMAVSSIFAYLAITSYEAEVVQEQQTVQKVQKDRIKQLNCLAKNIYHEARSQSLIGQKAVALVTINRVNHPDYPSTVCGVVYQAKLNENGTPILHKCQFSWFCDGKRKSIREDENWEKAKQVAEYVYDNYGRIKDVTDGAIMYHATYVRPYWNRHYTKTIKIESHIFYK